MTLDWTAINITLAIKFAHKHRKDKLARIDTHTGNKQSVQNFL